MSKKSPIQVRVGDALISRSPIPIVNKPWYGIRITKSGPDRTDWVPLGVFETREEASLKAQSLGFNPIVVDFEVDYRILEKSGKVVKFHSSFGSEEDR